MRNGSWKQLPTRLKYSFLIPSNEGNSAHIFRLHHQREWNLASCSFLHTGATMSWRSGAGLAIRPASCAQSFSRLQSRFLSLAMLYSWMSIYRSHRDPQINFLNRELCKIEKALADGQPRRESEFGHKLEKIVKHGFVESSFNLGESEYMHFATAQQRQDTQNQETTLGTLHSLYRVFSLLVPSSFSCGKYVLFWL